MSSYLQAIRNFPPDDRNKIEKRINDWSKESPRGQRVARNIGTDHFLPVDKMTELLHFIKNDPLTSWELFEKNYQNVCYSQPLQGGKIKVTKKPQFFGAAVEYETFFKHLKDNYPSELGSDDAIIRDFISRLNKGELSKILGQIIRLKKFSVWATWNEDNFAAMPFDYCKTSKADEVRANMGLNRDDAAKSSSLLLFVYSIPNHIEPQRPTIADAGLSEYFEPPSSTFDEYGLTVNWQYEERMSVYSRKARPECIHDSILLLHLKLPMEMRP